MACLIQLFLIKAYYLSSSYGYCFAFFLLLNADSLRFSISKLIAKQNNKTAS